MSRTIFAMSAALALLLLYLFTVEIPRGKEVADAPASAALFSLSPNVITRLTLRTTGGSETVLARTSPDAPWRLAAPIDAAADAVAVGSFLSEAVGLRADKTVDAEPKALKPYGLAPPAYTLLIAVDGVDREVLDIGDENPNRTGRYARTGLGSPVVLISPGLTHFFQRTQDGWRDARLFADFHAMEGRVEAIVIERPEGITRLAQPEQSGQIAERLGRLRLLRVDTFLDDPGMTPVPGMTLRLLDKEKRVLGEMTFGPLDGEKVQASAPAQPTPFLLRRSDVEPLLATPSSPS